MAKDIEKRREYYQRNKSRINAQQRAWRAANRERVNKKQYEYNAAHREQRLATYRRHNAKRREKSREYNRRNFMWRKYGITPEDFDRMLVEQVGRCGICGAPMRSPHVDHDHETGKTRQLLCGQCNVGIGMFKNDPARLRAAAIYLETSSSS